MKKINSNELQSLKTLIKEFMVDRSNQNKTFDQLVAIFNSCYRDFNPDPSNDLRVCCYANDMRKGNWKDNIILIDKNGEIIDGIHRGIAYLKCIKEGVKEKDMPNIFLKESC